MTQTVAPVSDKQNPGSWTEDGAGTNLYEALDDHPDTSPTDSCISPSSGNGNYFEVYLGQLSDPTTGNVTIDFYAQRVSGGATVTCTLYCATNGAIGNSGQVTPGATPTAYQFAVASSAVHSSSWDNATGLWLRFTQDTNNKQVSVSSAQASAADAPAGPSGAIAASATAATAAAAATAERPSSIDADITSATASLAATAARPSGIAVEISITTAAAAVTVERRGSVTAQVSPITAAATALIPGAAADFLPNPSSILLREPRLLLPNRKPIAPVILDRGNPLTRGLKGYWPLVTADPNPYNYAARLKTITTAYGTNPTWGRGEHGNLFWNFYPGADCSLGIPVRWTPGTGPSTFVFFLRTPTAWNGSNPNYYDYIGGWSGVTTNVWSIFENHATASGQWGVYVAPNIYGSGNTLSTDTDYMLVCALQGTTAKFWQDGSYVGSTTTVASNVSTTTITLGSFYARIEDIAYGRPKIYQVFLYDRVLTNSAVADLYRDPYQLLVPA